MLGMTVFGVWMFLGPAGHHHQRSSSPLICYVGNLQPEKGPDILISGFKVLTEKMRDRRAELVVLGDGPLMRPLESLVREYGLEGRARLQSF
jgi:glycosyltransferase involved in cell wall biosynthesis